MTGGIFSSKAVDGLHWMQGEAALKGETIVMLRRPQGIVGKGTVHMPSHLWCWLIRFSTLDEFGALLQCCKSLLSSAEIVNLWHYNCFVRGFAKSLPLLCDAEAAFSLDAQMVASIDWERLCRVNFNSGSGSAVCVQAHGVCLRLPLLRTVKPLKALLYEVSRVLQTSVPIRFRQQQWGARPGALVKGSDSLCSMQHLMLEFARPTPEMPGHRWPLPPHEFTPPQNEVLEPSSSLTPSASLPPLFSTEIPALIGINAPFYENGVGLIYVDLSVETLGALFEKVRSLKPSGARAQQCPWSADSGKQVRFALEDPNNLRKASAHADTVRLRDLCWAASEYLTVELAQDPEEPEAPVGSLVILSRHQTSTSGPPMCVPQSKGAAGFLTPAEVGGTIYVPDIGTSRPSSFCVGEPPKEEAVVFKQKITIKHPATTSPKRMRLWWDEAGDQGNNTELDGVCNGSVVRSFQAPSAASSFQLPASETTGASSLQLPASVPESETEGNSPQRLGGPAAAKPTIALEKIIPHYEPRLIPGTQQARQFEFHPLMPGILLTGDKIGGVNVVNTEEGTPTWTPLVLDSFPFLGLSWMKNRPQYAVCGAAHCGAITCLKFDPDAEDGTCALEVAASMDSFPKLSSLSVNNSNDFLLVSGFTQDLALYDLQTGKVLGNLQRAHSHFVNISRFAHTSPHLFATASFDHTCKVWDLRRPLQAAKAVRTLDTKGLNVMVTFSPDDKHLLCSGVDTRLTQWEVAKWRPTNTNFSLRNPHFQARYRRSMYFHDSKRLVTAATDESHLRILSTEGKNLGIVDVRGLCTGFYGKKPNGASFTSAAQEQLQDSAEVTEVARVPYRSTRQQLLRPAPPRLPCMFGRFLSRMQQRLRPQKAAAPQPDESVAATVESTVSSPSGSFAARRSLSPDRSFAKRTVIQGEMALASGDQGIVTEAPGNDEAYQGREYIQSVRAHPTLENQIGVLLASYQPSPQSCIAVVDLVPGTN